MNNYNIIIIINFFLNNIFIINPINSINAYKSGPCSSQIKKFLCNWWISSGFHRDLMAGG